MSASHPTKIAFVITELDVGGAERTLVQLVLGLPRDAWEARVYCLGPWGPLANVLQDAGITVKAFDAVHVWDGPRTIWRLYRELLAFRPGLVQTFLFHANLLGRLAGAMAGVQYILSGVRVAERRSRVYGWFDYWTNFLVRANVCVSRGVADYCEREVGLSPSKTVIIPNGVDPHQFAAFLPADTREIGCPPDKRVVLTVGRLEPQKGIDLLLEAIQAVTTKVQDVVFVIIGDGPDRGVLQRRATELQIEPFVRFLGRRHDVPRWYKRATVLVLPSRWEGMPNVVLEAMATGTPVIATRVEGIAELLEDQVSGLVVPVNDAPALSTAILQILQDGETRSRLAKAAQTYLEKNFTTQAMVSRYADLYGKLLRGEPVSAPESQGGKFS